ncbi:MAG TPA: RICIN domain-containing protein [Micromonosporaceae bacterium]|nr:RICIN domain-containing protein [Micromonosporaceae bacterium]
MSTLSESPAIQSRRRIHRAWRAPVIVATALLLVAAGAIFALQRASAATIVQGTWYHIVSRHSGKLMEVANNSTADGAMIQQYENTGCLCQQFRFESAGTGWWRIIARHSGKAVDLWNWNTADGAEYRQWPVTSGYNQQFEVLYSDNDYIRFRNRHSGKVLDVWEWSTANGGRISQYTDHNGWNQQWRLVPVGGGGGGGGGGSSPTGLVGWATQNGGTTGGGNAPATTVTSASALSSAVNNDNAKVIRVSGTISCSGMIRVRSNTTILGNSGATISGCGFTINGSRNVIIRNLTFRNWDDDAINVEQSATNIWIDHNSFTNGYDGAVDIKRGSDFITVSWNRIFNHDKSMLLGHSDSNASQDVGHLRVTYHHNWFDGSGTRHPRVRFGNPVHVYNNYYFNNEYGVASTMNAGVLVEGNYFENVDDPTLVGYAGSGPGSLVQRNNVFVNSGSPQSSGGVAAIPYSYSLDPASNVKSIVTAGAGAGRISV